MRTEGEVKKAPTFVEGAKRAAITLIVTLGAIAAFAAFHSWLVPLRELSAEQLRRNACVSPGYDKLPDEVVTGSIVLSDKLRAPRNKDEQSFRDEVLDRIKAHNANADPKQFTMFADIGRHITSAPYRDLIGVVICPKDNIEACRHLNIWIFRAIPTRQMVELVFANSLQKDLQLLKCRTGAISPKS